MPKLLSKNKKILFLIGLALFFSLTIPRFVLADTYTCPGSSTGGTCPPEYTCYCESQGWGKPDICSCIPEPTETSNFCPGALPFVSWAWWKCILEFIASLPLKIPIFFLAALGIILAILGGVLLLVLQGIAGQMIYYSINLSTTPPTAISDIAGDVRTVAVQLLFLFLAIIGLATILKIQEYQFKKALVPLIVVALLINFSGAIVEAVVNIGNSLTLAFFGFGDISIADLQTGNLKIIEPTQIFETFKAGIENLRDIILKDGHFFDTINDSIISLTTWAAIGYIAALFFIVAALAIFIFGLVFFIRVVFIWLLIIIAPIAFVSAVFKTKEIEKILPGPLNWNGWWTSLLEWSFMGVGLALWLALAMKLKGIGNLTYVASTTGTSTAEVILQNSEIQKLFGNIFAYLAPLVALWLGVTTAPGMMGQMASQVYGKAKGFVTAVAAGGAIAMGAGAIAGFKGGFGSQWAKRMEGLEEGEKPGIGKTLKAGVLGVGAGLSSGLGTMSRRGFGVGLAGIAKPMPEEIRKEAAPFWAKREFITGKEEAKKYVEESYEKEGPKGVGNIVKSKSVTEVLRKAALDKLMEEKKISEELTKNPEAQRIMSADYEEAVRLDDTKKMGKMERMFGLTLGEKFGKINRDKNEKKFAEDIDKDVKAKIFTEDEGNLLKQGKNLELYTKKIIASVKTAGDVEELQKGWWDEKENPQAMETAQKFWTGAQWGTAARTFGREFMESLEPIITQLKSLQAANDTKGYLHSVWDRPGLARFSETAAAQELGFSSFYELAPKDVKKKYKNIREILAEKT